MVLNRKPKLIKGLSVKQKQKIDNLLYESKPTPGDVTIGDVIKKALRLSDKRYNELGEEIGIYVEDFYARIMRRTS